MFYDLFYFTLFEGGSEHDSDESMEHDFEVVDTTDDSDDFSVYSDEDYEMI